MKSMCDIFYSGKQKCHKNNITNTEGLICVVIIITAIDLIPVNIVQYYVCTNAIKICARLDLTVGEKKANKPTTNQFPPYFYFASIHKTR